MYTAEYWSHMFLHSIGDHALQSYWALRNQPLYAHMMCIHVSPISTMYIRFSSELEVVALQREIYRLEK